MLDRTRPNLTTERDRILSKGALSGRDEYLERIQFVPSDVVNGTTMVVEASKFVHRPRRYLLQRVV